MEVISDLFWTFVAPTIPAAVIVIIAVEYRAWRDGKKICSHCGRPWSTHRKGRRGVVIGEE